MREVPVTPTETARAQIRLAPTPPVPAPVSPVAVQPVHAPPPVVPKITPKPQESPLRAYIREEDKRSLMRDSMAVTPL